jgi:ribosomal protein S18 acetylase RimI-like enzyme
VCHIREAQIGDAAAIALVHIESWKTTYKGIVADSVIEGLDKTRIRREKFWSDVLAAKMKEHILFVAEDDEKIIGFVNGGEIKENIEGYDYELYAIYLLQSAQRKGIGRKLVEIFAEEVYKKGYQNMLLWVLEANHNSRKFYDRLGGVIVKEGAYQLSDLSMKTLAYGWSDIRSLIQNEG